MKSRLVAVAVAAISAVLLATAPAGASKNLYFATGNDGTNAEALAFSLGADGTPAPLQTIKGTAGGYFNAVSMTPDGKYLFMADYNAGQVVSLAVGDDGKLSNAPGSPVDLPGASGPYGSAVTPDGKFVIFGMYDGHGVQAFEIGPNGALTATPGGLVELGPSVAPYGVAISSDSRTLYVPDHATDSIYFLRIAADGALTELPSSPISVGNDIYHVAVTPDGEYLYGPADDFEGVYSFSLGSDGTPTPLAGSPFPVMNNTYGGFSVSPDGRMLYGTSNQKIQSASIAPDGTLTAGPTTTIDAYNPGLALNPSGTRLYNGLNANSVDNRLITYSVGATGDLTEFGSPLPLAVQISPDSDSMVVTPAQPPAAALSAVPGSGKKVTFDASGSTDSDSPIASYTWDFGDGQTATTTTPKVTHTYGKDGKYQAKVTLTDADNCSTELVFTGRSAYCNGSAVATAGTTASVDSKVTGAKLTARKAQKQKGKGLLIKVKAGAKEAVKIQATGKASFRKLKGKVALKKVRVQAGANKYRTLKLVAKSKKARAAVGRKGKATITVNFTDKLGNSATRKITVKLK